MHSSSDATVKLVGVRFLLIVSHFVATCLLFYTKIWLIQIELDPDKNHDERREHFDSLNTGVTAFLILAIVCMAVEGAGVLSGYTTHQRSANILSALAHMMGFLSTTSMVLNGWSVAVYPTIITFCSLMPAGFDILWWSFQACTLRSRRR